MYAATLVDQIDQLHLRDVTAGMISVQLSAFSSQPDQVREVSPVSWDGPSIANHRHVFGRASRSHFMGEGVARTHTFGTHVHPQTAKRSEEFGFNLHLFSPHTPSIEGNKLTSNGHLGIDEILDRPHDAGTTQVFRRIIVLLACRQVKLLQCVVSHTIPHGVTGGS